MAHEEINAVIAEIDAETTRVGQLVLDQAALIKTGMTSSEVSAARAGLTSIASRLKVIGSNPDEPVPPIT